MAGYFDLLDEETPPSEADLGASTRSGPYVPAEDAPVLYPPEKGRDFAPPGPRFNDLADMLADQKARAPQPGEPGYKSMGAPMREMAEVAAAGDVAAPKRSGSSSKPLAPMDFKPEAADHTSALEGYLREKYPEEFGGQKAQPQTNPDVLAYLTKKYESDFSPDKYAEMEAKLNQGNTLSHAFQFLSNMGNTLARKDQSGTNAQFDALRKENADATIGSFARRKAEMESAITRMQAMRQAQQAQDPASSVSRAAQAAILGTESGQSMAKHLAAQGIDVTKMSATDLAKLPGAKDLLESSDKRFGFLKDLEVAQNKDKGESQRALLDADVRRGEGAANRANALALERIKQNGENARSGTKDAKPAPEQEVVKIVNQIEAMKAIQKLRASHNDINGSAVLPFGNTAANRYDDNKNALVGQVAAGVLPGARETPALMEEFKRGFPSRWTGDERSDNYFKGLHNTAESTARSQIAALKSAGYDPAQIAELEKQVNQAAGGDMPKQVTQGGHVYVLNEATGKYE